MTITRTTIDRATPELQVEDVGRAQQHYRDTLGFDITWRADNMGAVAREECSVFLRERANKKEPGSIFLNLDREIRARPL